MFFIFLTDVRSKSISELELWQTQSISIVILLVTLCPPDFVSVVESSPPIGPLTLTYWLLKSHWLCHKCGDGPQGPHGSSQPPGTWNKSARKSGYNIVLDICEVEK